MCPSRSHNLPMDPADPSGFQQIPACLRGSQHVLEDPNSSYQIPVSPSGSQQVLVDPRVTQMVPVSQMIPMDPNVS